MDNSIFWICIGVIGGLYYLIKLIVAYFLYKNWDSAWVEVKNNKSNFKLFYQKKFNNGETVYDSDLESIRREWRGNIEIFQLFEIYLLEKKER